MLKFTQNWTIKILKGRFKPTHTNAKVKAAITTTESNVQRQI